jgi:hypothetical protein
MRVVPWSSWGEWASVGGALLAGLSATCPAADGGDGVDGVNDDGRAAADATAAACAGAASRVATWRARGRVPLAVDVTAALAEARAADSAFTGRPGAWRRHCSRRACTLARGARAGAEP